MVEPIEGALGWLRYTPKHADRGVAHCQRQGMPPGWLSMPQVWSRGGDWPVVPPLALARLFRSACSVCGSTLLTGGSVGDEVARLLDAGQDCNDWLEHLAQGVGVAVGPGLLQLDAWRCVDCGEVGLFGPVEVGP